MPNQAPLAMGDGPFSLNRWTSGSDWDGIKHVVKRSILNYTVSLFFFARLESY